MVIQELRSQLRSYGDFVASNQKAKKEALSFLSIGEDDDIKTSSSAGSQGMGWCAPCSLYLLVRRMCNVN